MAKSTYLELVNRVIRECGISGGSIVSVSSQTGERNRAVQWTADADLFVQKAYRDWNFLHNTGTILISTGINEYTKISKLGIWDEESIYLDYGTANYIKLDQIEYKDYRDNYASAGVSTGNPSYFVIKPNKDIILYPTPIADHTLTTDYWALPTRLSDNADTSAIPEEFEDVIIYRAKILYAQHEEANDLLEYSKEEFQSAMQDLMANEAPHHNAQNLAIDDLQIRVE